MEIEEMLAQEFAPAISMIRKLDRRELIELIGDLEDHLSREGDRIRRGVLLILLWFCEKELTAASRGRVGA